MNLVSKQHPGSSEPGRPRRSVLEDTLKGITETLEHNLFAEEISSRAGLFQSLDPRVKVIVTLALIVATSLSHNLAAIAAIYVAALALAILSKIPAGFFVGRVWLALPFFTGLIVLPALFITPGPPLLRLPLGLVVTATGLTTVLFLLMRVSTSVSLTLLLILTTPWNAVLSGLSVMHVPDVVILILGMTYRYIYLLLHITNDMFLSRKSRMVGRLSGADERKLLAATAATLLDRSLDLSSEVYLAMQSRGYRGPVVTLKPFKMRVRDWAWGAALVAVAVAVSVVGRL
jgi:cobalt/nickel transport system permease protein